MPFGVNCPVCNARVSLELAWNLTPKNRFGLLEHSTGVVCPVCSTKLRITQGRSALAIAVMYLLILISFLGVGSVAPLDRSTGLIVAAVVVLALYFIQARLAKLFARVQRREGTDTVDFPVERLKQQLDADQAADDDLREKASEKEGRAWQCRECREENPAAFELCWKCGVARSNGI